MPQMSPMSWIFISSMFLMVMSMIIPQYDKKSSKNFYNNKKMKNMNLKWKW